MNQRTPINQSQVKNLGYVFLQSVHSSLKLPEFFKNKQRNTKIEYNFNNVIRLLVFSKILKPESKIATFKSSSMYFEKLASNSDSIYDVLTRLFPLRNELQAYLHESVKTKYGRPNEHAFFDCTNYYFEIDSEKGIRKKGPSKEHRKTPIVQMVLLMDSNGIPMVYHLFPGNESEKVNLRPVINRCKIEVESRPAHVSGDDHIKSHFSTCFLSLLLTRVIEHEIERKYSPQQLIEGLRSFNYTLVTENIYQCLNRNEVIDLLDETFGLDTSKYRMTLAKIKNIIATSKKE